MKIATACAVECDRQKVGVRQLIALLSAYHYAMARSKESPNTISINDVLFIGRIVEPKNVSLRHIPVTFPNGGYSLDPTAIPQALEHLISALPNVDPDEWTHVFLNIHPFVDGNGRSAFILYNWLKGSLADPYALPDFYKER